MAALVPEIMETLRIPEDVLSAPVSFSYISHTRILRIIHPGSSVGVASRLRAKRPGSLFLYALESFIFPISPTQAVVPSEHPLAH
jgi:hypothetical protein